MSHRATNDEVASKNSVSLKRFVNETYMPHIAMAGVTLMYIGYSIADGSAAVPPTISLAFTGTLGAWFSYLIRQRSNKDDGEKEK